MYDWFIPVLLASTLVLILATVFIQIAIDTFKRKKYDDAAPSAPNASRRAAH